MDDTPDPAKRPPQATMAASVVVVSGLLLVFSSYEAVATLQSVENREAVTKALETMSESGLSLGLETALDLIRIALFVSAAGGAAAAILGGFVFRGHRQSRIALSVVAVPVLLVAPLAGGILGPVVFAGTVILWSRPVRDWFAGKDPAPPRPPREETRAPQEDKSRDAMSPGSPGSPGPDTSAGAGEESTPWPVMGPSDSESGSAPGTTSGTAWGSGWGAAPTDAPPPSTEARVDLPPPVPTTSAATSGAGISPAAPAMRRPAQVTLACALTWLFSGTAALGLLSVFVVLLVDPGQLLTGQVPAAELDRFGLTETSLRWAMVVFAGLMALWAVAAMVLAWWVWRGRDWARWILLASAVCAAGVGLAALPAGLVHQAACIATVVLLLRAPAAFFQRPSQRTGSADAAGTSRPTEPKPKPPVW